mmetsp:Transcript_5100/g.13658  ORF Transcript_5100/g.13658 Transcript_5100/m.13658 type:complete len:294 (-) Transcript_5100:133-1014(-)
MDYVGLWHGDTWIRTCTRTLMIWHDAIRYDMIRYDTIRYDVVEGKHVLLHCKGLMWVPFCQNPVIFMGNMSIEEQLNMRALYAILFTEIAVFLFEDSVLVSIWIFEDGFDRSDTYDVMNGWVTLLSTFMGCAILIVSVILSLRHWVWGSTFCDVMNQLMSSLLFCALFGCIFLYLVFVMLTGFQIAAGIDEDEPILDFADFLLFVCFSWAIATYFSCKLRWQAVQPQRLIHQGDESALGGTAVHDVEIDGGMNSNGDGNGAYVLPVSPEPTSSHEDEAVEVPIAVAVPVNDPF